MTLTIKSPQNGATEHEKLDISAFPLKRIEELESFAIALANPALEEQCKNDDVFAMTLQLAIDEYGVSQTEIANLLQTQKSTVGRWKSGTSAPITYSRPAIISVLSVLLEKSLEERKKSL